MKTTLGFLVISALGLSMASAAITDGLVAYWDYDNGQEAPVDFTQSSTINWNGGYESGYVYNSSGGVQNSGYATLTNANGYCTDNLGLGTTTGFSVSFAVRNWDGNNLINFRDGDAHIILKVRFGKLALETTGAAMGVESSGIVEHSTDLTATATEWHRMTMTCGADGVVKLYVDGVEYVTDLEWSGTLDKVQIASAYGNGGWNTTADMDDIGIWNRALTTEEAQSLSVTWSIPEPATATLSLLALAGLAVRRRRK